MLSFLKSTPVRVATLLIVLQAAMLYSSVRTESVPEGRPLSQFPATLGSWQLDQEGVVDEETKSILKADDLLTRSYVNPSHSKADLFVAAFRSQRNGKTPHSPKNCLPGSGWTQLSSDNDYPVEVDGQSIRVNRYIVEHGPSRSVVLYWYESRDRVVANEFKAKFWVMVDAVRLNRTDTALVRVVVDIDNKDEEQATRTAIDFVKAFFGPLHRYLPA